MMLLQCQTSFSLSRRPQPRRRETCSTRNRGKASRLSPRRQRKKFARYHPTPWTACMDFHGPTSHLLVAIMGVRVRQPAQLAREGEKRSSFSLSPVAALNPRDPPSMRPLTRPLGSGLACRAKQLFPTRAPAGCGDGSLAVFQDIWTSSRAAATRRRGPAGVGGGWVGEQTR